MGGTPWEQQFEGLNFSSLFKKRVEEKYLEYVPLKSTSPILLIGLGFDTHRLHHFQGLSDLTT